MQRSLLLAAIGDSLATLADINKVIQLEPEEMDHLVWRGIYIREIGDFDTSLEDLRRAISTVSENPIIVENWHKHILK